MYISNEGEEIRKFHAPDWEAIAELKAAGIRLGIVGLESLTAVEKKARKAGIELFLKKSDLESIKKVVSDSGFQYSEVALLGATAGILGALKYVGFSASPRDAIDDCKMAATYVCGHNGGGGCVREFAELILKNNQQLAHTKDVFSSQKFSH